MMNSYVDCGHFTNSSNLCHRCLWNVLKLKFTWRSFFRQSWGPTFLCELAIPGETNDELIECILDKFLTALLHNQCLLEEGISDLQMFIHPIKIKGWKLFVLENTSLLKSLFFNNYAKKNKLSLHDLSENVFLPHFEYNPQTLTYTTHWHTTVKFNYATN
jgi:hypothetical protein